MSSERKANVTIETAKTHGEKNREEMKKKKPRVYEKIQFYLNNLNVKDKFFAVDIAYDWQCNMQCSHCFTIFLKDKNHPERKFTPEKLKKLCNELDELGVFAISLQGGEPLSWKNLPEIIKAMDPKRFTISIVTNGLLLTKEKAQELKDFGIDRICVSIDSGIAEEHDKFRKYTGAFQRTMDAVDACLIVGLTLHIHTVVTHTSLYSDGFNRILEYVKEKNLGMTVLISCPVGEWKGRTDILITEEDAKYIQKLHEEYPLLRRDVTPVNDVDTGCRAVTYALYITVSGDVLPCPFLHFSLGNVFEEPLADILAKGHRIKEFAKYHSKCLAGEDSDFIEKYMTKTFESDKLLKAEDIFELEGD